MTAIDSAIARRLDMIRERVARAADRAGRTANGVTFVGVTKTIPPDPIREAIAAGLTTLGENRVQEAAAKIPLVDRPGVSWHFVGHLQSNKARTTLGLFDVIQSIDSLKLATAVDRLARERGSVCPVLLEVNASGEPSKHGFDPDQLERDFQDLAAFQGIGIEGLMTVGPLWGAAGARTAFASLRELRDRLRAASGLDLSTLSMGMTGDFEIAVEEGSTMIRLGRAIFGERS